MKIYDVSVPISASMPLFPGDPVFKSQIIKSLEAKDGYQLHEIVLGNHAGTHVDAPAHFLKDGTTVDELPLEVLNGRARVVEIHDPEKIDVRELKQLILVEDFRVLFKTRNSLLWNGPFSEEYIYLTEKGAKYLTENGVKLVGIDYLSIDRYGDESYPAHKVLLKNDIILVEGLNLAEVEEGEYEMSCLPLRLKGFDASPARVILKK
jgi:arylformamidase